MKLKKSTLLAGAAITIASLQASAQTSGINVSNMDKTVNPADDFYHYANGTWLKNTQIPSNESRWGSFNELADRNYEHLKKILEECASDKAAQPGSNRQKIGSFYHAGMDTVKLEKEGFTPIAPLMVAINKIAAKVDLMKFEAELNKQGLHGIFGFIVEADQKSSNDNAVYFSQARLGLPDKMYYTDAKFEKIREAYKKHVENMFSLLGDKAEIAKKNAETVFAVEAQMAEASMGRIELRDPDKQYNKFTKEEFFKKESNIEFNAFLAAAGVTSPFTHVIVTQPLYFDKLNQLMSTVPMADWKTFFRWLSIHQTAPFLSDRFAKENFSFYGTILQGAKEQQPRWKRVMRVVDGSIGEALGQIFAEKYFTAEAKQKVNTMVDNLTQAFRERIKTRTWMSDATKTKALEKLNTIMRKLGYPDKWKDYSTLSIKNDSYLANVLRSGTFSFNEMIHKIGKPVDKTEWGMTPPTVNAYYNPSYNEIVFPAGIMQPPFFDAHADDAANYGVMGAVIGHELTHGFDDQGAKYDAEGNLKDWWTPEDMKNFEARTALVRNQFNAYVAIDTLHVNGQLTLGENIADLGGLTMSYYAYKLSLKGKKSPVIDGFTGEQRFFIAWAQGWKSLTRPEALKQLIATNPHSPGEFRAWAPLTNLTEFYEAFGVKSNNKMFTPADKRAEVW
ncbi:MAG: M13 family metallopeptidase [Bacteroidetes bacterium]|nr:M13 family metallopeptidase [Bacteroidota bacterium]